MFERHQNTLYSWEDLQRWFIIISAYFHIIQISPTLSKEKKQKQTGTENTSNNNQQV